MNTTYASASETYAVEIHDAAGENGHVEHRRSTAQTPESAALHQWEAQTKDNGFGLTPGSTVRVFALDVIDGQRRTAPGESFATPVASFVVERDKTGPKPFVLVEEN